MEPGQRSKAKSEAGFTLVEVILAATILVIAIVPIFDVFTGSLRQIYLGRDIQQASWLIQQAYEEAKAIPFAELQLGSTTDPDYAGSGLELRRDVEEVLSMPQGEEYFVKKVKVAVNKDGRVLADAVFLVYKDGI